MIFLAVFFSLTAITHFSLYRFVLRWFDISHPAAKTVLLAAVSFLAVSFMAAFFLLRWVETPWTINFYRFAAVWFALSVKLVLAVAATWILYGVLRVFGVPESAFRFAAGGCVALALAWSAFGFWTAFHPVLTPVDVSLENLPERWRNRTIVQLSDLHLGHFHTPASMQRLAERVNALAPDLVVITGDLFDGMADGMPEFVAPLSRLVLPPGSLFCDREPRGLCRPAALPGTCGKSGHPGAFQRGGGSRRLEPDGRRLPRHQRQETRSAGWIMPWIRRLGSGL